MSQARNNKLMRNDDKLLGRGGTPFEMERCVDKVYIDQSQPTDTKLQGFRESFRLWMLTDISIQGSYKVNREP